MSSAPSHGLAGLAPGLARGRSFEWDAYEDVDKPSRKGQPRGSSRGSSHGSSPQRSPQRQCYSNEALVDGDEYFSDQTEYEEHYLAKRQRQDSGTSLTSRDAREPPVGASPVHAAPPGLVREARRDTGGFEGIATYEQRRLLPGKSMPQLSERLGERPQPQPRHRYEMIHPPPQQPPPPPHRPGKATPTRRCNSSASGSTPPRRAPVRSPSTASLVRRGTANGLSTPASRFAATPTAVLSSPATSPLRHQQVAVPFVSPSSTRRNLTPLMNSMSPKPLPRTPRQGQGHPHGQPAPHKNSPRQAPGQQQQQYNHRRTMSMSGSHQKTAVIAPSTYTGYDLSGRAYADG